jgi:hypothetical protein
VQKRVWQFATLLGLLSIPSFASAEDGLIRNTLNETTTTVENATTQVLETSPQVDEILPIDTTQSVSGVVDSVNTTTQTVRDAVSDEKSLVEIDLPKEPSIKLSPGKVEVEVLSTPIVKVAVTEPVQVDVETEIIQLEQTTSSTEIENTKASELEGTDLTMITKSNPKPEAVNGFEEVEPVPETTTKIEDVEKPNLQKVIPKFPGKDEENLVQLKVVPTIPTGPSTQNSTNSGNAGVTLAVFNTFEIDRLMKSFSYIGKERLFFDQWLNAPPSQPPQFSLFTISRI